MGKKTKKEKILAEYHRKLQALGSPKTVNYSAPTMNPVYHEPQTDYSYVLSDLRRIVLLTALAICAQLVLWYKLGR